jgi:hypothetical protein
VLATGVVEHATVGENLRKYGRLALKYAGPVVFTNLAVTTWWGLHDDCVNFQDGQGWEDGYKCVVNSIGASLWVAGAVSSVGICVVDLGVAIKVQAAMTVMVSTSIGWSTTLCTYPNTLELFWARLLAIGLSFFFYATCIASNACSAPKSTLADMYFSRTTPDSWQGLASDPGCAHRRPCRAPQ